MRQKLPRRLMIGAGVLALLFAWGQAAAPAATYYVDATEGDDAAAGTAPAGL